LPNKPSFFLFIMVATSFLLLSATTGQNARFGRSIEIMFCYQSSQPSRVVLFISGDSGWNLGKIDRTRALVVGIEINAYLRKSVGRCRKLFLRGRLRAIACGAMILTDRRR
jgi:hypothetical protein